MIKTYRIMSDSLQHLINYLEHDPNIVVLCVFHLRSNIILHNTIPEKLWKTNTTN